MVRVTATDDFNADRAETVRWRTYLALVMSVESMPPGDLRTKVAAAVARADDLLVVRPVDREEAVPAIAFGALVRSSVKAVDKKPWDTETVEAKLAGLQVDNLFASVVSNRDVGETEVARP